MKSLHQLIIASFTAMALALAGCAIQPPEQPPAGVAPAARWTSDAALQSRLLALDPAHISDRDVRETLAKGPTPRIMLLHGGVYPVHLIMESFGSFLTGMGYPEAQIRDPGNGNWSYSPYLQTSQLAGLVAWQYEHDGLHPMLVGHSQGGLSAVRILKDLAGWDGDVRVYNPLTATLEARTTIIDPLTGRQRPVVGVSVASASVVGTGGWSLALPVHWKVVPMIRSIPDTVDEFTGYRIGLDLFAWDAPGLENVKTFHPVGKAIVRNITLPAEYSHVFVPDTEQLALSAPMRAWINAFDPDNIASLPPLPDGNANNVMWAADIWHSIKKHWCLEAQRLLRAPRPPPG